MALGLPPRDPYETPAARPEYAPRVITVGQFRALVAAATTRVDVLQAVTHLLPMRWANVIGGVQYVDLQTEALRRVSELPADAEDTPFAAKAAKKTPLPSLEQRLHMEAARSEGVAAGDGADASQQVPKTRAARLAAYRQAKEESKAQLGLFHRPRQGR